MSEQATALLCARALDLSGFPWTQPRQGLKRVPVILDGAVSRSVSPYGDRPSVQPQNTQFGAKSTCKTVDFSHFKA